MNSTRELLEILVNLSIADDEFAKEEQKYIIEIGISGGLSRDEVDDVVAGPYVSRDLKEIPDKDRLNYMINVIQLMKVDGKVRRSEIDFCEKIALRLGYLPSIVADMSQYVYSDAAMMNFEKLEEIARANSTKI